MIWRQLQLIAAIFICCFNLQAQTDLTVGNLGNPSLISPYYFGPNAFPIPDMLNGSTSRDLRVELGADCFYGFQNDITADIYLHMKVPLFSERVNLTLWMPIMEWWQSSLKRQKCCRLQDNSIMSGHEAGDIYVSTDMWLLQAHKNKIDMSIRAAIKTASGNGFAKARYYDCPGYFFDASISKPFKFTDQIINEFRISASGGFLCWQTNNGRQNDAIMYGISLHLKTQKFSIQESIGGYVGWENFASSDKSIRAGDCPLSLKSDFAYHYHKLEFLFRYQVGLYDWPFHQFRFGIAYHMDILNWAKKK